ncbi:cytochrome P450 family protein [Streptomyces hoynatensis]|uniref:cytochrome P450 family protein n=1 Tax=Streptomyces hoynatensis TaxID=1141874 RepID=UPI001F4D6E61|nr:cytochrome P450 [Streptomyces hoynatensis]
MRLDEDFFANPYEHYAHLRAGRSVHLVTSPDGTPAWLVTRYADVRAALSDPRLSTNAAHSNGCGYRGLPLPPALRNDLLHLDPPDHTRLRRLVSHAFKRRSVESLRPLVQARADALLDALPDRSGGGGRPGERRGDLMASLALPLPLLVVCDLLGVPEEERGRIASWTDTLLIPGRPAAVAAAMRDAERQLREVIARKRRRPGPDLLSGLIEARDAQGRLSEDELVSVAFVILAAGHETTASFICNAVLALLDPRLHWERLLHHPELLPGAIEELLRYDGPLSLAIRRFATEDMTIGGVRVRAGDSVLLSLASANRDEEQFPCPDEVRLERMPQGHLAFGRGTHLCLGIPLARLQAEIALSTLLRRAPKLELAVRREELIWRPSHRTRHLTALPVTF